MITLPNDAPPLQSVLFKVLVEMEMIKNNPSTVARHQPSYRVLTLPNAAASSLFRIMGSVNTLTEHWTERILWSINTNTNDNKPSKIASFLLPPERFKYTKQSIKTFVRLGSDKCNAVIKTTKYGNICIFERRRSFLASSFSDPGEFDYVGFARWLLTLARRIAEEPRYDRRAGELDYRLLVIHIGIWSKPQSFHNIGLDTPPPQAHANSTPPSPTLTPLSPSTTTPATTPTPTSSETVNKNMYNTFHHNVPQYTKDSLIHDSHGLMKPNWNETVVEMQNNSSFIAFVKAVDAWVLRVSPLDYFRGRVLLTLIETYYGMKNSFGSVVFPSFALNCSPLSRLMSHLDFSDNISTMAVLVCLADTKFSYGDLVLWQLSTTIKFKNLNICAFRSRVIVHGNAHMKFKKSNDQQCRRDQHEHLKRATAQELKQILEWGGRGSIVFFTGAGLVSLLKKCVKTKAEVCMLNALFSDDFHGWT
ncbi:UNVERIFIED_CONTAM: hypothetical protein HDU68_004505 [Siphonaria sp. JEL0065]|nr:hypothetical protein HDU68_004505 [Siphonaria sp. JEL0065]